VTELESLRKNTGHIKDIVATQQSYAKVVGVVETMQVTELVEDALRVNTEALARHDVRVTREFAQDLPAVSVDKHKVLQILVNLIRNAKHACDDAGHGDKRLMVRVANGEGKLKISVIDNGVGIPAENLTRIFNHGFTTRKNGHGFGLHSGALAAKELGGALLAHSDGPGHGATFTLELPVSRKAVAGVQG
jgi:C4-dicarboxylate-specific signal transduction histidine kinase